MIYAPGDHSLEGLEALGSIMEHADETLLRGERHCAMVELSLLVGFVAIVAVTSGIANRPVEGVRAASLLQSTQGDTSGAVQRRGKLVLRQTLLTLLGDDLVAGRVPLWRGRCEGR